MNSRPSGGSCGAQSGESGDGGAEHDDVNGQGPIKPLSAERISFSLRLHPLGSHTP